MPDILVDGITELHQANNRVGLVFSDAGGAEHWAMSPAYVNPGWSSPVTFKRPTDATITASNAAQFQSLLTSKGIWKNTWTYLKKNTHQVPYNASSDDSPPYPPFPMPGGDTPVTSPQGVDIGTGSLFEDNQNQGLLFREGAATSAPWQETWVLYATYPASPGGDQDVQIKGPTTMPDYPTRAAFLAAVRNAWRAGTRVFTATVAYYKVNMPPP